MTFVRFVVVVMSLLLHYVIASGKPPCPAGHFRNSTAAASTLVVCSPCSTCPINHIVRKPCSRQNDTVCGPFYEFEFFNQRQQRPNQAMNPEGLGWVRPRGDADRRTHDGPRAEAEAEAAAAAAGGPDAERRYVHYLLNGQQTTASPDGPSTTLRCGGGGGHGAAAEAAAEAAATEWRVVCYGLVAALVIVISVALAAFALFTYCRTNAKALPVSDPETSSRVTPTIVRDAYDPPSSFTSAPSAAAAASTTTTTIVVDRSVRHLEEQLFHNERRKAFLRWLFGSSAAADRLFSSNDYLEERHRRRFLLLLDPSSTGGGGGGSGGARPSSSSSSSRGRSIRPTDFVPLEPYPGMISTNGRTDHDRSHLSTDAAHAAAAAAEDDVVAADDDTSEDDDDTETGDRMDMTPRGSDDGGGQTDEQGTNQGERSLLIPDQCT